MFLVQKLTNQLLTLGTIDKDDDTGSLIPIMMTPGVLYMFAYNIKVRTDAQKLSVQLFFLAQAQVSLDPKPCADVGAVEMGKGYFVKYPSTSGF